MVVIHQQGRERLCEAKLDGLKEVNDWIADYKRFWENKLDNLEAYLYKLQNQKTWSKKKIIPLDRVNPEPYCTCSHFPGMGSMDKSKSSQELVGS